MEISIVWPNFWLTAALVAACLVFVLQFFGIAKVVKVFCKNVLLNPVFISFLSLVLFLGVVVSTLYLLNCCTFTECGYLFYFAVLAGGLLLAAVLGGGEDSLITFFPAFDVAASLVGLGFMVCYHFSYMWYMLGFSVVSIILLVWRNFASTRNTTKTRKSFDEDDL